MTIKVKDLAAFETRHAEWSGTRVLHTEYEVLAIRRVDAKRWQYLVEDQQRLKWWDADLFAVVEERLPADWITEEYTRRHWYDHPDYNFRIPARAYHGPKAFVENRNFFFDIHENPQAAYEFYRSL